MTLLITSLTFIAAFLSIFAFAALAGYVQTPVERRMRGIHAAKPERQAVTNVYQRRHAKNLIESMGEQVAPQDEIKRSASRRKLAMAGYYSTTAFFTFWGVKVLLMILLPSSVVLYYLAMDKPPMQGIYITCIALLLGMNLPDFVLKKIAKKRHIEIFKGLPDMLDLMVVCVESGLAMDAAMQRVSDEFVHSNKTLSLEMKLTGNSIRLGQTRAQALRDLGDRTGSQDLKSFCSVLIQADKFGSSIAKTLRVYSEDLRIKRRQIAEEHAAKLAVKIIFPTVLFIMPATFVVLAGPGVVRLIEFFINMQNR